MARSLGLASVQEERRWSPVELGEPLVLSIEGVCFLEWGVRFGRYIYRERGETTFYPREEGKGLVQLRGMETDNGRILRSERRRELGYRI